MQGGVTLTAEQFVGVTGSTDRKRCAGNTGDVNVAAGP